MKDLLRHIGLLVGFLVTAPVTAQDAAVILNPGTLSGTVSIANRSITSVTVRAIDTVGLYSANTTVTVSAGADQIEYALTVEGDRDYYVMAQATVSADDYARVILPAVGPFNVPVGGNVPVDLSVDPAVISGTISTESSGNTITSYSIYAYITLPEFPSRYSCHTYANNLNAPGDSGVTYTLLLAPDIEHDIYAYISVDGLTYRFYDYDTLAPAAGAIAYRDYPVDVTAASLSGAARLEGIDVTSASVFGYANSPYRSADSPIPDIGTGAYTLGVDEGAWRLYPRFDFDLPDDLNDLSGTLRLPDSAAIDVQAGDLLTDVDFIVEPGFIPGTLNLWGANTDFSAARVQARTVSGSGYVYSDVAPDNGAFLWICSPNDWRTDYYQYLSFTYPDDPDPTLHSTVYQYGSGSDNLQTVTAGQIAPAAELTYGTITVRRYFYVAGNGTLSRPSITAIRREQSYSQAYGYGSYAETTEGQAIVTLLLPGTYTVEAFAYVEGSNTEFGTVEITVDEGDVVVIGGTDRPTIKVTNPTNEEVICGDSVTVEGTVTDDYGVASILINGQEVAFDPNEDPVQFSYKVDLAPGENVITIVVSDLDQTDPVVLTLTVVSEDCTRTASVSSGHGGCVTEPGEGDFEYDKGAAVSATAVPDECYRFVGWTGTAVDAGKVADPNDPNTTVVMDGDYTLVANFEPIPYTVTVSSTDGGSVIAPGEGTFEYGCGTVVVLEVQTDAHCQFVGWTGTAVEAGRVAEPNDPNTVLTIDADYTVAAKFEPIVYALTVTSTQGGSVTQPGQGAFEYDGGTSVSIEAVADEYADFLGWSGTAVENGKVDDPTLATTTVTIDGSYTLQANFKIQQHTIKISWTAGGFAYLTAENDGLSKSWSYQQTIQLDHGTRITLGASADPGYAFAHWSGTFYSSNDFVQFILDRDYDLTATFVATSEP